MIKATDLKPGYYWVKRTKDCLWEPMHTTGKQIVHMGYYANKPIDQTEFYEAKEMEDGND